MQEFERKFLKYHHDEKVLMVPCLQLTEEDADHSVWIHIDRLPFVNFSALQYVSIENLVTQ